MRKKRTRKPKLPSGFDSKLEVDLHAIMKGCSWKPDVVSYIVEKTYNPDAKYEDTLIEIKGRFRDSAEASKYLWIRETLADNEELVFVFSDPNTPMPRARRRKDGSRRSVSDWATHHEFTWYSKNTIPEEWK